MIEQRSDGGESAASLERQIEALWRGCDPLAPLLPLVVGVVEQLAKLHGQRHCPIASWTRTTLTGPSFSARTGASMAFASPTTMTRNLTGWIYVPDAF